MPEAIAHVCTVFMFIILCVAGYFTWTAFLHTLKEYIENTRDQYGPWRKTTAKIVELMEVYGAFLSALPLLPCLWLLFLVHSDPLPALVVQCYYFAHLVVWSVALTKYIRYLQGYPFFTLR